MTMKQASVAETKVNEGNESNSYQKLHLNKKVLLKTDNVPVNNFCAVIKRRFSLDQMYPDFREAELQHLNRRANNLPNLTNKSAYNIVNIKERCSNSERKLSPFY